MGLYQDFCTERNLSQDQVFELVLGCDNPILPGSKFHSYFVVVGEESMLCCKAKGEKVEIEIPYAWFDSAVFGIGSGNLWLQCYIKGDFLPFCTTKKFWKSPAAQKLIEKLTTVIPEGGMRDYKRFTGKLSLLFRIMGPF